MWFRIITFLFVLAGLGQLKAQQQGTWDITVGSPGSVTVSNTITYDITLGNQTGFFLSPVYVTNVFPTSLQFVRAMTNATTTTLIVSPGNVIFNLQNGLSPGETVSLSLTLRPTQPGTVTNRITATTPTTVTNLFVQRVTVVNPIQARSDLTLAIGGLPTSTVFVRDWVAYTLTVSRQGPDPVSGVFVTNFVPTNALVRGSSLPPVSSNAQQLVFGLGTVSLQSTQVHVTIEPLVATNIVLSARVGAGSNAETNVNNNTATNTLPVATPVLGVLQAEVISNQLFNPQNALFEQLLRVSNVGSNSVPSARVILSNFNYRVVNAVGTNAGFPFVVHAGALDTNQTTELLLEYVFPDRRPKDDPELIAYPAGNIDLSPPMGGTNIAITNVVMLPPSGVATDVNRLLLEFPATPGARYTILYTSETNLTMLSRAQPSIVAQANRVQWIDYGPPKTLSRPTNQMRFYRAIQMP